MKAFGRPKIRARPLALYFPIFDNAVSTTGEMFWFWVHVLQDTYETPSYMIPGMFHGPWVLYSVGGYGYTTRQGGKKKKSRHKLRKKFAAVLLCLH
jgi:hypothetical protein